MVLQGGSQREAMRPVCKLSGTLRDTRATGSAPTTEPMPPSRGENSRLLDICPETGPSLVSRLRAVSRVSRRGRARHRQAWLRHSSAP